MKQLKYADFIDTNAPEIAYGFFGRQGGVSSGIFSSLNCKSGAGDDPAAVHENRSRVAGKLGVNAEALFTLEQVHGNVCLKVRADQALPQQAQADALVTSQPDYAIGVLTADCAPVLLSGQTSSGHPVIGAAHAGWGGAVKGILESTLQAMREEGAEFSSIRAAIGPCIMQPSYEVSADFKIPFLAEDPSSVEFFTNLDNGKLLFDLPGYVRFRLVRAGLPMSNIVGGDVDTYAGEADWFSFRRSTHRQEPQYGRQISTICIRSC